MARYIDADKIDFSPLKDDFDRARAKIIVLGLPTADVVEVVRCKDCVKRGTFDCVKSKGDHPTTTKNEEFCCWGERSGHNEEA